MATDQQGEALQYFRTHAGEWQQKAETLSKVKFNVIQTRNQYVLEVIKERSETKMVLDVGCGTGDLVCDIARSGIKAIGVDFAEDMIELAVEKAEREGLEDARFESCSIFDYEFSKGCYDVISANGFIEYISQDELFEFLALISAALAPGGSFVVGSRNRLFNLFTLNAFTQMELDGPDYQAVLDEALELASGKPLESLSEISPAPLQRPEIKHAQTGIRVSTRFQYTPLQLVRMLKDVGLEVVEVYPVHIHGVPPVFKDSFPDVHTSISNLLQSYGRHRLEFVPFASTFMTHAVKGK